MAVRTVASRSAAVKKSRSAIGVAPRKVKTKGPKVKAFKVPPVVRRFRAVAVNLARRPDRWVKVQKTISKNAPWLSLDRLDAVDGARNPPSVKDVTKKWSTRHLAELFHWYKAVTIPMSPGERGCCGSHVKAWRIAAKSKVPLLVIEDDAVALPSFTPTLCQAVKEAPKDTEMIFLSSKDRGYPKRFGKVLMTPEFVWTTVGYLVFPAAARKLLGMLPMDMPVDNFLAWHIRQGAIKAFSVKPAALRQAQTWNVGSDVPHSDDVAH
jgi:GR25 family glycosyltransferase involved in LPS biosynthesis|eukprot:TRINITY_DN54804_c0_g1_i1.p1 TRINITY_DN54804_c0_g1~~TRINITY_DN54804_c0_g1_i1.p1  ORF type:complete len:266 (+),score=39.95 TRINITY_DN54804_c0_g1_i1:72-869(+)